MLSGVLICDCLGRICSINNAALSIFGYSSTNELVGVSINILMYEVIAMEHDAFLRRFFAENGVFRAATSRVVLARQRDGNPVKIRISLSFLHDVERVAALVEEVFFFVL